MNNKFYKCVCVLVTYNPKFSELIKNIAQIQKQVSCIVIVDNSTNQNLIEEKLNVFYCIINDKNYGIAFAQNQGIKKARSLGATHVLTMDQDTFLPDGSVKILLESESILLSQGVKLAAISPRYSTNKMKFKYSQLHKEKLLISSGMLIRMSVLDDVGYMNENFFIDGVDDEWCIRAICKRYKLYMNNDIMIKHNLGKKNGKITFHDPVRFYYMFRNYLNIILLNKTPFLYKIHFINRLIKQFVKIAFVKQKTIYLKNILKGVKDSSLCIKLKK